MTKADEVNRAAEELRRASQQAFPAIPAYRWEHAKGTGDPFQKDAAWLFRVGGAILCVAVEAPVIKAEWFPAMPKKLTKAVMKQYDQARAVVTNSIAAALKKPGGTSLIVDME
jgi:hypothetical protein